MDTPQVEVVTPSAAKRTESSDLSTWLMPIALAMLAGVLSSWWFTSQQSKVIDAVATQPPRVVIMDFTLLMASIPIGTPHETMKAILEEAKRQAAVYRSQGYLVVDGGAVIDAPTELYADLDSIIAEKLNNGPALSSAPQK